MYFFSDDFQWTVANKESVTASQYAVKSLRKDDMYEFRVTAENKVGAGPPCDPARTRAKTPISKGAC